MENNEDFWQRYCCGLDTNTETYLELCGGIEFRLNSVQLHSEMLLIHLDCVTTFPLNLLLDQHLPGK